MIAENTTDLALLLQEKNWSAVKERLAITPPAAFNAQCHFALGMLSAFGAAEDRNLAVAIEHLERATQLEPSNVKYLTLLSETYLQARLPDMALRIAKQAKALAPENYFALIALGRAAVGSGERDLARMSYLEAHRLAPANLTNLKAQLQAMAFDLEPFWHEPQHGKRVALVRLQAKHADYLLACRRNTAFQHRYHLFQAATPQAVECEVQDASRPCRDSKKMAWVVERNGTAIGLAELVEIDFHNLKAEILIGFPDAQPYGISLETSLLVMEFAYSKIGLRKLLSHVYSDNPQSQRNTLHLGFRQEGLLRSQVIAPVSKAPLDLWINGCLAAEFFENAALMKMANKLLGRAVLPAALLDI